ncbi:MAG: hypothetical protein IJP07_04805 [Firmicutes bacterium]|nr:hypothetical protein [Bacillota bacterium]
MLNSLVGRLFPAFFHYNMPFLVFFFAKAQFVLAFLMKDTALLGEGRRFGCCRPKFKAPGPGFFQESGDFKERKACFPQVRFRNRARKRENPGFSSAAAQEHKRKLGFFNRKYCSKQGLLFLAWAKNLENIPHRPESGIAKAAAGILAPYSML